MVAIPNQSSVPKALQEFDEAGRISPSLYCDHVVDVMEEVVRFTLLTRDRCGYLTTRYSGPKEAAERGARPLAAQAMSHEVKTAAE
jgi:arsenic resistance protein ArsH